MPTNGRHRDEVRAALDRAAARCYRDLACDSIAYLTIVAATMSVGSPGAEYAPAWQLISEYLAQAERSLAAIDPSLPLELRTRIRENAMRLQQALEKKEKIL